jgi:hypothetical protein
MSIVARIWHICKATVANPQPKLCNRAKFRLHTDLKIENYVKTWNNKTIHVNY